MASSEQAVRARRRPSSTSATRAAAPSPHNSTDAYTTPHHPSPLAAAFMVPVYLILGLIGYLLAGLLVLARYVYRCMTCPLRAFTNTRSASSGHAAHAPPPECTGVIDVVDVAGTRTELMTWEAAPGHPLYYVMLPGNPGAVDFYARYLQGVYDGCDQRVTVVCLGHACHSVRSVSDEHAPLNLRAQVDHKLRFFQSLLDRHPDAQVVLAGHSVGAYMALEALRSLPASQAPLCVLLFPTLAHIGATVNGRTLMPVFKWLRWLAWAVMHVLVLLPRRVQKWLARVAMPGADVSSVDAALSLMHPDVAYSALWMALHEMLEITALDDEHMQAVQERCVLYFGAQDGWVNDADAEHITRTYTRARAYRCTEGHKHAFVLSQASSTRLAELTVGWLRPLLR